MSMLTLLATALPALAHHPEISAQAECVGDGTIRVNFTASTWTASGSNGLHDDVRVGYSWSNPGGGDEATTAPYASHVATGTFTNANGRQFSGSFALPASDAGETVYVTSWAVGPWNGGNGGNEYRSTGVQLPADCPTDVTAVNPTVTRAQECGVADSLQVATTAGVVYSLSPDGADVSGDTITGPAIGMLHARAASGDYTLTNPSWTFPYELDGAEPCDELVTPVNPTVTRAQDCGVADSLLVATTEGVVYSLSPGGADVSGDTITGPDSGTLYARAADGYTLGDDADWTYGFTLAGPEPCHTDTTVTVDCVEDEVVVTVDSNETGPLYATIDGTEVQVVGGEAVLEGLADGTHTVVITDAAGAELDRETFTVDCDEPQVVVSEVECTVTGGTVTVTITEEPGGENFTVTLGDLVEETTGGVVTFEEIPDGTHLLTITSDQGYESEHEVVVDCDEPVVVVSAVECAEDGGTVVVTVDERPEDRFTVTIGDQTVDVVDGEAVFAGIEDGTYTVTVRDGTESVVHEEDVVVDCDEPIVVVSSECDAEDGTVTVDVTETPGDEVFTVTIGDESQQTTGGTLTFEGLADGEVTVTITSDQGHEQVSTVTIACDDDTEVGGEVVEKPRPKPAPDPAPKPAPQVEVKNDQLAATGVATNLLVLSALLVLALGATLIGGTRRGRSQA